VSLDIGLQTEVFAPTSTLDSGWTASNDTETSPSPSPTSRMMQFALPPIVFYKSDDVVVFDPYEDKVISIKVSRHVSVTNTDFVYDCNII